MDKHEKRIEEMLQEREWTFAQMQNMSSLVDEFAGRLYDEMSAKEKLDYVWSEIGGEFQRILSVKLKENVAIQVKELLMNANINFNGEDKNEVSKRSLGRESPKERPSDETSDSEE